MIHTNIKSPTGVVHRLCNPENVSVALDHGKHIVPPLFLTSCGQSGYVNTPGWKTTNEIITCWRCGGGGRIAITHEEAAAIRTVLEKEVRRHSQKSRRLLDLYPQRCGAAPADITKLTTALKAVRKWPLEIKDGEYI